MFYLPQQPTHGTDLSVSLKEENAPPAMRCFPRHRIVSQDSLYVIMERKARNYRTMGGKHEPYH
ncbi:hypothetical protein GCM10023310_26040 [Paenibacillus vulneris]